MLVLFVTIWFSYHQPSISWYFNVTFFFAVDHSESADKPTIESPPPNQPISPNVTTPQKKKFQLRVKALQSKLRRIEKKKTDQKPQKDELKDIFTKLDNYLPPNTANFIKSQLRITNKRNSKGYRWNLKDKMFAMSVFYHSRKVYSFLSRLFVLPSKSTILRTIQKSTIYAGFSKSILTALKQKVLSMDPGDKQCVLVFDEMTIKSGFNYDAFHDNIEGFEHYGDMGQTKFIANHAGAFMIRGLQKKWKQAIGYFLSSGPIPGDKLQILVNEALDKLTSIGLTVRAIICDQGSNNRKFLESLEGVCVDQPFFMHAGSKIHVIYDPPHLLKNVRNNLKKHGFILDGNPVLWDHIVNFNELDKSSEIRMAPKLTDDHIELPPFKPMRVNLAAQVFSHSVAAGIFAMSKLGSMSEEAQQTARFLEKMDRLFNACNSHSSSSSKVFGHAISDDSGHGQFLQSMSDTFAELTTCEGRRPPCFTGWRITIASILSLWNELHDKEHFNFVLTSRLNQDCIENLFSIIRGKGGHRDNPDTREFRAAFRQVVFDQLLLPSKGSNCAADVDKVLLSLSSIASTAPEATTTGPAMEPVLGQHSDNDSLVGLENISVMKQPPSLPEENIIAYMAGYLLRKSKISECATCKSRLIYDNPPNSELYFFLKAKSHKETGMLVYPTEVFVDYIESLETRFTLVFAAVMHMTGVMRRLYKNMDGLSDGVLHCTNSSCFAKLCAMTKLYIKVRLHHALKLSNRQHKVAGGKRKRKMLKLSHL